MEKPLVYSVPALVPSKTIIEPFRMKIVEPSHRTVGGDDARGGILPRLVTRFRESRVHPTERILFAVILTATNSSGRGQIGGHLVIHLQTSSGNMEA